MNSCKSYKLHPLNFNVSFCFHKCSALTPNSSEKLWINPFMAFCLALLISVAVLPVFGAIASTLL
nr:MAG TPA: hypothetical protein [Bacteriophage sp.]